jgi:hypothetical protein
MNDCVQKIPRESITKEENWKTWFDCNKMKKKVMTEKRKRFQNELGLLKLYELQEKMLRGYSSFFLSCQSQKIFL